MTGRGGNHSLWPEFCRIPAPRSRLRTRVAAPSKTHSETVSEPRAKRAAGPRERAVPAGQSLHESERSPRGWLAREQAVTAVARPRRAGSSRNGAPMGPLTLAGILPNSGVPFAALNARCNACRNAFGNGFGAASEAGRRPARASGSCGAKLARERAVTAGLACARASGHGGCAAAASGLPGRTAICLSCRGRPSRRGRPPRRRPPRRQPRRRACRRCPRPGRARRAPPH